MDIQAVEEKILEKLKAEITDLQVEPFPDNPSRYFLKHPRGAVLVRYQESRLSDPQAADAVVQTETMVFEIDVVTRSLRGKGGSYQTIQRVRQALTGLPLNNVSVLTPVKVFFAEEENGIWVYAIEFVTDIYSDGPC